MHMQEDLKRLIFSRPELFFVPRFLSEHDSANLYLVGGMVRDLLLGRPILDVDFDFVVTGLSADDLQKWLSKLGHVELVGARFGVFKFLPTDVDTKTAEFVDIALPRTEQAHENSSGGYKQFDVQSDPNLSIQNDLARRDFTINAMAVDLRTLSLIDPHGGQADLETEHIRAVGDPQDRFKEDLSRVLRAIRFASELSFNIEEETFRAITQKMADMHKQVDGAYVIPREVLGLELAKTLGRNPIAGGVWLEISGALKVLMPGVSPDTIAYLGDVRPGEIELAVIVLLAELPVNEIEDILTQTGLNSLPKKSPLRVDVQTVTWITEQLRPATSQAWVQGLRASRFERIFMNGRGVLAIRALEVTGRESIARAVQERKTQIEQRWSIQPFEHIPPLISGDDVLACGVEAGPRLRQILEHIRDEQLEGRLMNRDTAIKQIKSFTK
jgi:tRNA nucleotidyltransferase/poly(A) polymerase